MPPDTPQRSVIKARNRAVQDTTAKMSDYDRKNMEAFGFIYADGSYSDERQPRGATIVTRRPSVNHMWDPDTREWYEVHDQSAEARQFRQTAQHDGGAGIILPDRAPGQETPLVGIDAEKAALERRLAEINAVQSGETAPMPPKTDVYPTHSVAHSVRGVVTSGDPAAAPSRPESVLFTGAGAAPSQDVVRAQMDADAQAARIRLAGGEGNVIPGEAVRIEEDRKGIHNTGDQEAKVDGVPAQQGASNTNRGIMPTGAVPDANNRGTVGTSNMNPQPQINADTATAGGAVPAKPTGDIQL